MTRQRRTPLATAAAVAATLLVLGGCGSAPPRVKGTAAPAPTSSSLAPSTTAAPATPSSSSTTTTAPPATTAPVATTAPPCPANLASRLATTGSSTQLVTVVASTAATTTASLELWQRQGACWTAAAGPWTATIGGSGFSDHHREGDGSTPTGAYGIGPVMYGNAPNPGVQYPYHQLTCGDWWDEDPASPAYNTFQHVACGSVPPFGGGSEALWQETTAYPSFAFVEYNAGPVVPDAGSAIFIHADVGGPTNGCVSLPVGELDRLLAWLRPAAAPLVVLGPSAEISRF